MANLEKFCQRARRVIHPVPIYLDQRTEGGVSIAMMIRKKYKK